MSEKLPQNLNINSGEFEVEINYEAIRELIHQWFDCSFYESRDNPELTKAYEKLQESCDKALFYLNKNTINQFYEVLKQFEENFGTQEQRTDSLRELMSYFNCCPC